MLEEFENAASFIRLGVPCTLIRHENGAIENALAFQPAEELENVHELYVFV